MSEKLYLNKYLEYKRRYLNLKMSGGALQSKPGELAVRITTDEANIIYGKIKIPTNDISGYNPNYKLSTFNKKLKSFAKLAQTAARDDNKIPLPEYDAFKKFMILTNLHKFSFRNWEVRERELIEIFHDVTAKEIVTPELKRQGVSPLHVLCPDPNEPHSYNTERGRICFDRTIEKINSRLISQAEYQARETVFHKFYFDKDQRNVDEVDILLVPPPSSAAAAAAGPYIREVDGSELPTKQELLESKIDDIKRIFLGTTTVCKVIEFTEGNNKRAYLQIIQPGYGYETYFIRSSKDIVPSSPSKGNKWEYIRELAINSNSSNMSALFQLIGNHKMPI